MSFKSHILCGFAKLYTMSQLDKLWDDTVGRPQLNNGLGKLKKYSGFWPPSIFGKESDAGDARTTRSYDTPDKTIKVTRNIIIVKLSSTSIVCFPFLRLDLLFLYLHL